MPQTIEAPNENDVDRIARQLIHANQVIGQVDVQKMYYGLREQLDEIRQESYPNA